MTLTIGAAYHSKTAISDLARSKGALPCECGLGFVSEPSFNGSICACMIPLTGKIKVKDFEWPQMVGIGMAYQAMDNLMIVADYKWINWAAAMKNFTMTFDADATQSGSVRQGLLYCA